MKTIVETLELQHRALEVEVATFEHAMATVSLVAFFGRWKGPFTPARVAELKPEWRATLKLLAGRLRDEDKILHPIHRRLFGS
jgi:hypothetical protein